MAGTPDDRFTPVLPTTFVHPTWDLVCMYMSSAADRSHKALCMFFGTGFIDDKVEKSKIHAIISSYRTRWYRRYHENGLPKKSRKSREKPKKVPESTRNPKPAPKQESSPPVPAVNDAGGLSLLENPPLPSGRHWEGERWLVRDKDDADIYDLAKIKSLSYSECWESRRGYWWNQEEKKWRRGQVPPAYYFYYWFLTMYENPAKYENPHPLDSLHKRITATYKGGNRHLTLLGRGSHKTTIFVEGHAAYTICEKQDKAKAGIFISCLDDNLSKTTYNAIIENLSENPRILSFYGYLIDSKKKAKNVGRRRKFTDEEAYFTFQTTGLRPGLKCMPFGEIKITGWHPYAVYLDDIQEKTLSPTYRERYKDIFGQRIIAAVGRHGNLYITGTIKGYDGKTESFNDIYLWLEDTPGYITHKYPSVVDAFGNAAFPPMSDVIREKRMMPVLDEDGKPVVLPSGLVYEEEQEIIVEIKNSEKYIVNFPSVYTLEDLVYIRMEMKNDDKFFSEYQLEASNPQGKFFQRDRMRPLKELDEFQYFTNVASFREYVKKFNKKVALWVDPGGKGGHGMSIVVMCKDMGCWFLLDCSVIRKGLAKTAEAIAKLIEKWNIRYWGVEGNFTQKEFVGEQLRFYFRKYLEENGMEHLYRPPVLRPNKGDKLQRIREGFSAMLGLEGMSYTFYYNPSMIAIEQFMREVREFGLDVTGNKVHEFDLLDAVVSADIHILKDRHKQSGGGPICSGGRFKRAKMIF